MLRLLRLDKAYELPFLLIIAIALWIPSFDLRTINCYYDANQMPLYNFLTNVIGNGTFMSVVVSIIVMLLNCFLLVRINNQYKVIEIGSYLPCVMYMMLSTGHETLRQMNPMLFATSFLLLAIDKMFGSFKKDVAIGDFFQASFWIGVASLFYFNAIYLELFVFIALIILRTFNWHEWASSILGWLTPILLTISLCFYFDAFPRLIETVKQNFIAYEGHKFLTIYNGIYYAFSLVMFLIAIGVTFSSGIRKIAIRKEYSVMLFLFLLLVLFYSILPSVSIENLGFIAIPFAFFFGNYLVNIESKALGEVIFTTYICLQVMQMVLN